MFLLNSGIILSSKQQQTTKLMQLSLFEQPRQELFSLREYQKQIKQSIYDHVRVGTRRILVYAPTGAGKTAIISSIFADILVRNKRAMLVVHRDFLIEQSRAAMLRCGICPGDIGIIKAGYPEDRELPIQIAGLQTLQNRRIPADLDMVVLDEAHTTAFFEFYQRIKEHSLNAIHLGFSASPWRLKSADEYFGLHYDAIAMGPSIGDLIELGYLARPRYFGYGGIVDLARLETNASGEYKESAMQSAFIAAKVPQQVVLHIEEYCQGRTGVIFNAGVEQSKIQTQLLNEAGVPCVHLDAETPFRERQSYFNALGAGEIRCISSIGCLTEGFDVPSISFVVLARATKSRALYVQMSGRGLRPFDGKEDCLILDYGGNVKRLGMLTRRFLITLEPTPKKEEEPMTKECPGCHELINIFARICPHCGFVFEPQDQQLDFEGFEQDFGELFDPDSLKKIRYARSQRKMRFTKNQPPDQLWENFSTKHNKDGKNLLCNDWLFGAIFGGIDNCFTRQRMLEYLEVFAPTEERKREHWVRHHLEIEFGKPGKQYRVGKGKTVEAKIGRYSSMEWWEILQCSPSASWAEIKLQYRKLAMYCHPDLNGADSTFEMQMLNSAYDKAKILKGV